MKRSNNNDYPNFSSLYRELNELFYERVISCIPQEIWTRILGLLHRRDRKTRYSHAWVRWTLVSKKFYNVVYDGMNQIFINVQLFTHIDPSPVISRFTNLKHLTIPCFSGPLEIPPLKKLEKLKIRYAKWSRCSHNVITCGHNQHDFSHFQKEKFPSLTCFSFRFSCISENALLTVPLALREGLTKISLNGVTFCESDLEKLFPNIIFLKSQSSRFHLTDLFSRQLKDIYCVFDQRLWNFTGRCRVYNDQFYDKESMRDFVEGRVESGKRVGDWIVYENKKY